YAGGLVLPIAVDLGVEVDIEPAERIVLSSEGETVDLAADGAGEAEGWGRYPAAVAAELAALGRRPVGVHGEGRSNLPAGSALGSSRGVEGAGARARWAVADSAPEPLELVSACRRAELRAVGVPCGILDQAASLLGLAGTALLLDCTTLEYRHVGLPTGLEVVVVDSGQRALAETGYAERQRRACRRHARPRASRRDREPSRPSHGRSAGKRRRQEARRHLPGESREPPGRLRGLDARARRSRRASVWRRRDRGAPDGR